MVVRVGEGEERRGKGGAHTFEVHGFHGLVHAFDDARHIPCHLSHRSRSLHSARYCIDPAGKSEQVKRFALFADRVGGVYPCAVVVALLQSLYRYVPVYSAVSHTSPQSRRGGGEE